MKRIIERHVPGGLDLVFWAAFGALLVVASLYLPEFAYLQAALTQVESPVLWNLLAFFGFILVVFEMLLIDLNATMGMGWNRLEDGVHFCASRVLFTFTDVGAFVIGVNFTRYVAAQKNFNPDFIAASFANLGFGFLLLLLVATCLLIGLRRHDYHFHRFKHRLPFLLRLPAYLAAIAFLGWTIYKASPARSIIESL